MKKLQVIVAVLMIAMFSVRAHSQLIAEFRGAGSSAQFNTFALAAANGTALCGANHWTQKNGANLIDPRSGSILPEPGNIWIVWNGAADGSTATIVCYYVSVDSIVGLRSYFGNATVTLASAAGTADGNQVPYIGGTATSLPADIITLVNGTKINFAATDIRPEDAKFASNRALTAYGALMTGRGFTGVGYQGLAATPWLGVPILSSVSTAKANPVDWAFVPGDVDPITGAAARVYSELEIGAAPVLVVANVSNTAAGHMGDSTLNINDISSQTLARALTAQLGHVRDLTTATYSDTNDAAIHVWIREPLSGTYNTMDFNVPNSNGIAGDYAQGAGRVTGQEAGINPSNTACSGAQTTSGCAVESGNPLFHFIAPSVGSANGSTRGRVIGSGEMISTTNLVADSLGYSFWGFSSFATAKAPYLRYLTVDGVDPLSGGTGITTVAPSNLPQCVNATATPCILNFTNIKNGTYPIWSKYRAVYDYTDAKSLATNLVTLAQSFSTSLYSDFVPAPSLNVFRSHFAQVVTTSGGAYPGNNGIKAGVPETGGDMGGAVFAKQTEQDFNADTGGNQLVNIKQ